MLKQTAVIGIIRPFCFLITIQALALDESDKELASKCIVEVTAYHGGREERALGVILGSSGRSRGSLFVLTTADVVGTAEKIKVCIPAYDRFEKFPARIRKEESTGPRRLAILEVEKNLLGVVMSPEVAGRFSPRENVQFQIFALDRRLKLESFYGNVIESREREVLFHGPLPIGLQGAPVLNNGQIMGIVSAVTDTGSEYEGLISFLGSCERISALLKDLELEIFPISVEITVTGGTVLPRLLDDDPVHSPFTHQFKGVRKRVILKVEVNARGIVTDVDVLVSSGNDHCDLLLVKEMRKRKFIPGSLNGMPRTMTKKIAVNF